MLTQKQDVERITSLSYHLHLHFSTFSNIHIALEAPLRDRNADDNKIIIVRILFLTNNCGFYSSSRYIY